MTTSFSALINIEINIHDITLNKRRFVHRKPDVARVIKTEHAPTYSRSITSETEVRINYWIILQNPSKKCVLNYYYWIFICTS